MKEKKKLSLAAQIFIALVLAVIAGITDAEKRKFCGNLYQAIWYDLSEFTEIHCRSDCTVFHYVWNYFHEGH